LIITTEADCLDDVVTEEPEMKFHPTFMATTDFKMATTEGVEPLVTEECEDEPVTEEPEKIAAPVTEECEDEAITEEPEAMVVATEAVKVERVTEGCDEGLSTEALPELEVTEAAVRGDMAADTTVCEDEDVIEEVAEFAMQVEQLVLEEGTTECLETDSVIEELPEVFEMALADADLIFEEECEY